MLLHVILHRLPLGRFGGTRPRPVFGLPGRRRSDRLPGPGSSGCAHAPIGGSQVTAAGLCRTLTGFPILPVRGTSVCVAVAIVAWPGPVGHGRSCLESRAMSRTRRRRRHRRRRLGRTAPAARRRSCGAPTSCWAVRATSPWCPTRPPHREPWPSPLRPGAARPARAVRRPAARRARLRRPAASPGSASTLVGLLGPDQVEVHPAVSSVTLARARMGWSGGVGRRRHPGRPRPRRRPPLARPRSPAGRAVLRRPPPRPGSPRPWSTRGTARAG